MTNFEQIKAVALDEYKHEQFRVAVEKYKERLRNKKSLWDMIWPYKIVIIRKGKDV